MRTALISDIHGDIEGLQIVLGDIARQDCERIMCLGDLVDGGQNHSAVIQTIREQGVLTVQGNHDEFPSVKLSQDERDFLQNLPEQIIEDDVLFTHISPRQKKRKINDATEVWNVFDDCSQRLFFIGHVHLPMLWGKKCVDKVSATRYEWEHNEPFSLQAGDSYLICVGAVGRTRDWLPKLNYVIYDSIVDTVTLKSLEKK